MISVRYCLHCEQIRRFELNGVIKHSECKECGHRFAIKKYGKAKNHINDRYFKKLMEIGDWYYKELKSIEVLKKK